MQNTIRRAAHTPASAGELAIPSDLLGVRRMVSKGRDLLVEGQPAPAVFLLHEGWACDYKRMSNGERQIMAVRLPGSPIGLRAIFRPAIDCSVETLTDVIISEIDKARLVKALRHDPRLVESVLAALARDEAILAQHLVNVGRRSALMRTAHFLLELGILSNRGKGGLPTAYLCPLSQTHIADALGMTNIHLNRVLRQLREAGLLTVSGGQVTFLDRANLQLLAAFDPSYLV